MTRVRRVLIVALVFVLGLWRAVRAWRERSRDPQGREVRYRIPVGQDAAAVLGAVRNAGFAAKVAMVGGDEQIVATCDSESEVGRLRRVLSEAPLDMAGHPFDAPPVTFVGE